MMLLLVILLGMYLRYLRAESIYFYKDPPSFAKRGLGGDLITGDSLLQLIQNQFSHHFNMCFFSIQGRNIVIRHTTMI